MEVIDRALARRILRDVSTGFLVQHLVFLVLFLANAVPLLTLANLLCALACGVSLWLLKRKWLRAYVLTLYGAELGCLLVSALCVGWSAGFQLPLLGLTLLVFFAEYLGRALERDYVRALPLGLLNLGVFVVAFVPFFRTPGLLPVSEPVSLTLQIIWSALSFVLCIGGLTVTVRVNSNSERLLIDQAERDRLTDLYNRAGYEQLLSRLELKSTILLLVDGDKFKHVNDTYGHEVGDRVLKKIARVLRQNFRRIDCVCRIGGDEFAVLMLNTNGRESEQIRSKISRVNRELSHTEDGLPLISISVGCAFGSDAEDWKTLFNHADQALYQVKQSGGRDCSFYTDTQRK